MNFVELLPIGSIVLLKETEKKLMIFGIGQINKSTKTSYDYIGVLYPEGSMGDGSQFLFNHSDIEEIVFRGFENEERNDFIKRLEELYDNNNI